MSALGIRLWVIFYFIYWTFSTLQLCCDHQNIAMDGEWEAFGE